jgi:mannobiose 2-epimerase
MRTLSFRSLAVMGEVPFRLLSLLLLTMNLAPAATPSLTARSDTLPSSEQHAFKTRVEHTLRTNILPFWLEHARDKERGGFFGQIDSPLQIEKDAPRGALLTARILWTYSAAYRRYHDPAHLKMARWAYDDLMARFWDKHDGGLFWMVAADGRPMISKKLLYVQAFGIYGLSEFSRATGEREPLDRAVELYEQVERHAHDHEHLGYFEEFSTDWKISRDRGMQGSPMGSLGQKSQNVHLHLMEAYANLLVAWPDAGLKKNLREIVDVLMERVIDSSNHHLRLFMDEDWTPRSDTISFGHDIEFSWLLTETAELLGDEALIARAKKEALLIADATLRQGVDSDGAILGEADPHGITSRYKEWWSQAEGAVGFLNAYQISGEVKYRDASLHTWDFIERNLVDGENGEWFIGIAASGRVASPVKAGFWKCPYHNGRACMELIERLEALSH